MKKSVVITLLIITFTFSAFVAGFYVGRNYHSSPIEVSATQLPSASNAATSPKGNTIGAVSSNSGGRININTATLEQLDSLPGIGTVRAQAIIDYREINGPYSSAQDLLNVNGIGEKTLEKLLDYITVGG